MLVGAGGNITVQIGDDGVLLVDAGLAGTSDKVDAAIRTLSTKPIHYIIDTHIHADHTGGNEALAKMGNTIAGGNVVGDIGASAGNQATVIAAQEVLDRMSTTTNGQPAVPQASWPTETYTTPERKLYFNGEGVLMIHPQAAHTDGDTIVFFRRSDVISTGDIFVTTGYPLVDLARGGNIQGVINGLNRDHRTCDSRRRAGRRHADHPGARPVMRRCGRGLLPGDGDDHSETASRTW